MADDEQTVAKNDSESPKAEKATQSETLPSDSTQIPSPSPWPTTNRNDLILRARSFLISPQLQSQDALAKRRFLVEKGLTDGEIDDLLEALPRQIPVIPPRTYPQPPPSNLPNLLLALARVFTWVAGGSAAVIFIYYNYLLPLLTRSSHARHSLKTHQVNLLRDLTTSLSTFKESHAESFSVLPRPQPWKEPAAFAGCKTLDEVLGIAEKDYAKIHDSEGHESLNIPLIPPITLLRCGISDFERVGKDKKPTTEDVFLILEGKIPWLTSPHGARYENVLWETLSTCPLFEASSQPPTGTTSNTSQPHWSYSPPTPPPPSPLVASLASLSSALPSDVKSRPSVFQHTLQSLSDFTGYISTQVYVPYSASSTVLSGGSTMGPAEEDMRKEIRALKGLVLNRRSFMSNIPRTNSYPNAPS